MRKLVLYIAMSLDGYIADPDGGVSWLTGDEPGGGDMGSYPDFYERVDTIIMGYRTYHQIVSELFTEGWVYAGKHSYVLTHKQLPSTGEVLFTDEPLDALVAELKTREGRDIWLCGGADVVNQAVERDLIDRYHITVIPTLLGNGIRLFKTHSEAHPLRLVSTDEYSGMVDLVYERKTI